MNTDPTPRDRFLTILLHAVFFLSGIATVLIGQVLPILAARFGLNDLQSGNFFPAQLLGSLTGTLLTNWFAKSGRLVRASAIGAFLMALGVAAMNFASYELVLLGFLVNGLGIGLTLPAINVLILERNPEKPAAALNFLNFFWGLGAIVSKPFVDATADGTGLFVTAIVLAAPLAGCSLLIFSARLGNEIASSANADGPSPSTPIWTTPLAWTIAGFGFIHVGFESGIGGWLTTYTTRIEGESVVRLFSPTLLFFLFFVIGRGVAPIFFRFLSENNMLLASLFTILAGLAVILSANGVGQLGIGASLCGIGTSSVFPTNVSRFSSTFGADAMRRATPLFLSGTLGATVITWLIGFLSNRSGNLRYGMFVLAGGIVLLIGIQIILASRGRPH